MTASDTEAMQHLSNLAEKALLSGDTSAYEMVQVQMACLLQRDRTKNTKSSKGA